MQNMRSAARLLPRLLASSSRFAQLHRQSVTRNMSSSTSLSVALCQLLVGGDKAANIENAAQAIDSSAGSELVVLPECWNSPYGIAHFPVFAEKVPGIGEVPSAEESPSSAMLADKARTHNMWIIGGSVPERDGDKLYNTCLIFNSKGEIVGKHRKIHLFDINVPGKITFRESDSLSPGDTPTVVDTPWGPVGVGICYDIRFPELAIIMRQRGARIMVYPGAFNMVTGPAHWELLQRARAVDGQVYCLTCSPARDESNSGGYVAWGHSTVVSPWGEIVATTDQKASIVKATLELPKIDEMRDNIPCWKQKRNDIYELQAKL